MGPIIPNGVIPEEWNSIFALMIGMAFGYILESSGFSSSRKLAGVFYGYDFVVLKVFFTAGVVAAIGLYYLDYLNYLDISQMYVHPTFIWSAVVGGVIMGIGFVAGGFCPGTSLCAAAIGKLDGMVYVIGIMIGVLIFSEFYPLLEGFFKSGNWGYATLMDTFGGSPYWYIVGFTIIAILSFYVTDYIRKKVRKVFY